MPRRAIFLRYPCHNSATIGAYPSGWAYPCPYLTSRWRNAMSDRTQRVETEYSVRPDGKINVWQRYMGKFWWTAWTLIAVRRAS